MNKIAITLGEPAGIGPDLGVLLAQNTFKKNHIIITDPVLLIESAKKLKRNIKVNIIENINNETISGNNVLNVLPIKLNTTNKPGTMNSKNAEFVIKTIKKAARLCINNDVKAMVTGPISKSILNNGGYKISGHTEFLSNLCKSKSVMLLMNKKIKIALHTIHIPLKDVHKQIKKNKIIQTVSIVDKDMKKKIGIKKPKILMTGLNPHAGEDGLLGKEEQNELIPAIKELRKKNILIDGPCPADTAFIKKNIDYYDVFITMFHDQGLPVIKFDNFQKTVNITLGLPINRISVDHGTALDLVGTGNIDISSFKEALKIADNINDSS